MTKQTVDGRASRTWKAPWIGRGLSLFSHTSDVVPAPLYRKEFFLAGAVRRATLHICGLGYYVARINGQRVGDHVLDPVFSQYDRRVRYVSHDVTGLLKAGANVVGVSLGNGWYNCHTAEIWNFDKAPWRDYPKLTLDLDAQLKTGKTFRLVSDGTWRVAEGPVRFDGLRNGERYDARAEQPGWDLPGYDDHAWETAVIVPGPGGILEPQNAPPCRVMRNITPVSVRVISPRVAIFDMGQNMAGWVQLRVSGPAGTEIVLRYAERLNTDGDLDVSGMDRFIKSGEFQTDRYILKGQGNETWEPGFTYHGFRYVRVEGLLSPDTPPLDTVLGRVVHTSFDEVGGVVSSSETLNRLQLCTRRAYVSNFMGFPTDCPHREKNGWTGDAHLAAETGLWNFDAASSYGQWLDSMVDCQRPSGQLSCIVPCAGWGYNWGSGPAWDSALILIPWYIHLYTGDRSHIERLYPAMARYLAYLGTLATDDSVCFGLGDWCAVNASTPGELTTTGYYYADTCLMARFAAMTGRQREAAAYRALAARIRHAFNDKFYRGNGIYAEGQMTALGCAVYQGLVEDSQRQAVVNRLAEAVEKNNGKVDFGILGAKYVPRVLAENGRADLAFRLFTQPEFPGWAHWLQDGATTLRENWNNSDSQNHIMFGDISACLCQYFAGIIPDPAHPGFRRVTLRPQPVEGLDAISAWHRAPAGIIRSAWTREGGRLVFDVTLPAGTSGTLHLPDGKVMALASGRRHIRCRA